MSKASQDFELKNPKISVTQHGFNPQHVGRIIKWMNKNYSRNYDENFFENRKIQSSYEWWSITEEWEVVYWNNLLVGNLMRDGNGRLFLSGNHARTEVQSYTDSSIIFK